MTISFFNNVGKLSQLWYIWLLNGITFLELIEKTHVIFLKLDISREVNWMVNQPFTPYVYFVDFSEDVVWADRVIITYMYTFLVCVLNLDVSRVFSSGEVGQQRTVMDESGENCGGRDEGIGSYQRIKMTAYRSRLTRFSTVTTTPPSSRLDRTLSPVYPSRKSYFRSTPFTSLMQSTDLLNRPGPLLPVFVI